MDAEQRSRTVIVVTGGDPVPARADDDLPADAFVIAADSGIDHAAALGRRVDVAVGDFDSVSPAGLAAVERSGARVERHPTAKDRTDLELALDAVLALDPAPDRAVVLGGHGGRLDHLLANALLLASPAYTAVPIEARMGPARVHAVRGRIELNGRPGELVTLLAVGGPARGVRTEGLLYPLAGEDLQPGSTRGVSNQFTGPAATVTLDAGVLLAVLPGLVGPPLEEP